MFLNVYNCWCSLFLFISHCFILEQLDEEMKNLINLGLFLKRLFKR